MPNSYFRFKQFTIHQDQCAMKVSTDACIFGAVAKTPATGNVLDIGTGTGLLTLIIAQRSNCYIDAVELDEASFLQANENVAQSKWVNRINVIYTDIRKFQTEKKYDFIICNPPFFENHLRSASTNKNTAKHADELSIEDLMAVSMRFLNAEGTIAILSPESRSEKLIAAAANNNLKSSGKIKIRHDVDSKVMSTIHHFSFQEINFEEETILIFDQHGNHTSDFSKMMSPYYLKL